MRPSAEIMAIAGALAVCASFVLAENAKPLYANDFSKAELGLPPDGEFLVLDGGFAIKQVGDEKLLELPGSPLDTYSLLFGATQKDGVAVNARVHSGKQGRRFPTFAVGLNGAGGYRLQVSPAKKALELFKGDESKATAAFDWESDKWTVLKLQVRAMGGKWKIEGKAWLHSTAEPKDWQISLEETTAPPAGRASLWGSPYSGVPIRFDDLLLTKATD